MKPGSQLLERERRLEGSADNTLTELSSDFLSGDGLHEGTVREPGRWPRRTAEAGRDRTEPEQQVLNECAVAMFFSSVRTQNIDQSTLRIRRAEIAFVSVLQTPSVELRGFEPLTPCMPCKCATSCATAPLLPKASRGQLAEY